MVLLQSDDKRRCTRDNLELMLHAIMFYLFHSDIATVHCSSLRKSNINMHFNYLPRRGDKVHALALQQLIFWYI